jgi:hypothetical protein
MIDGEEKCNTNHCLNADACSSGYPGGVFEANSGNLMSIIDECDGLQLHQDHVILPGYIASLDQGHFSNWEYEIGVLDAANISTVNVTPKVMFSSGNDLVLQPEFQADIHDYLEYEGDVFFSLNVPDRICIKIIDKPQQAVAAFETINADILTGFDADFYADTPIALVIQRLMACYRANLYLSDLGKPIIPIYYPTLPHFFSIQDKYLDAVKARYVAFPLFNIYNINRDPRLKKLRALLIDHAMGLARTRGIIPVFLNSSPRLELRGMVYCCSSHTWRVYPKSDKNRIDSLENYFPGIGHVDTPRNHHGKEILKLQRYTKIMRYRNNRNCVPLF